MEQEEYTRKQSSNASWQNTTSMSEPLCTLPIGTAPSEDCQVTEIVVR
jgi:hypothetical protein